MSNNKSWLESGSSYFTDGKLWVIVGKVLMLLIALMFLNNYFGKAHERNTVLNQSDILQGKGMSKEIVDFRKAHNDEEPLWTGSLFGGMPAYQVSTWYHGNLFQKLDNVMNLRGFLPHPIGSFFLLFVGMFILLCTLKIDPFTSAVGAFAFMLSSYFFIVMDAGHNSKVNATAYLPMVMAGVLLLYRGRFWLGTALTILSLGLEINANHFQITYYGFFIIGAIAISELLHSSDKIGKAIGASFLVGVFFSWVAGLPKIVWVTEALLGFGVPVVMAIMKAMKEGNSLSAFFTGKNLTASAKPIRQFVVASLLAIVAVGIAASPNIGRLMTTGEYVGETMRGGPVLKETAEKSGTGSGLTKEYAYNWSYGVYESFTLINPFYFGDASNTKLGKESATYDVLKSAVGPQGAEQLSNVWPTYMGDQPFTSGPVYVGVVVCFLFILGLIIVPDRYRWWLLGATIIGIMLSWGRNFQGFSDIFFDNLPLYSSFRAVSMLLVIAEITMPVLAALALYNFYKNPKNQTEKQQLMQLGIAAGATLFILLVVAFVHPGAELSQAADGQRIAGLLGRAGLQPDAGLVGRLQDALVDDRASLISSMAYKGMLLVLLAAGVLAAYLKFLKGAFAGKSRHFAIAISGIALFGLVAWDMIPVDARYLNEDSFIKESEFMKPFDPTAADNAIKADKDPNYRVLKLGNPWNDAFTSYHHKSIGGYHPAKLRRYQDLIDHRYDKEIDGLISAFQTRDSTVQQRIDQALASATALNMMNCKYIIYNPQAPPLPNTHAMGHAWIVSKAEVLPTPDDVMAKLEGLNLRETMLVEEASADQVKGFQSSPDPSARVVLNSWASNEIKYQFSASKEQLVAFSEVYYNQGKGWKAYVDGQPAEHFRCNYIMRGMKVAAGEHEILFKFEPKSYYTGETLSLVFSLLLFAVVIGLIFIDFKMGGTDDEDSFAK